MRYGKEEWCRISNRTDLPFQNWHEEFNKFWLKHSKISKIYFFNGLILTKVYNVSAKKVQRSYVWLHSRLIQSLKENSTSQNWQEFGKFSPEHFKVSKLGPWHPFVWSWKCIYELKIYRGVFHHINE